MNGGIEMFKLKALNGEVNGLLRSGKDFVRCSLPTQSAKVIVEGGKLTESELPDYPICVDDTWFFEGTVDKKRKAEK